MASLIIFGIFCTVKLIIGLSTRGTHFVIGIPENRVLAEYPIVRFYVTSLSKAVANVTISIPYNYDLPEESRNRHFTLKPGEVGMEEYPHALQTEGTVLDYKGIDVTSTEPITIQIGCFNDFSSDAFVAFPVDSLSTEYIVMSYLYTDVISLGTKQGPSQFLVVSPENVLVSIKFKSKEVADSIDIDALFIAIDSVTNTFNITLQAYDTLQIQSNLDLTGTHILSTRPIAVVAGAVWSSVMVEEMGDHLVEQLPPTNTWGAEYLAVPVANRSSGDMFRVMAKSDDTKVYIYRPGFRNSEHIVLNSGDYQDFHVPSGEVKRVLGDQPILLMQLCASFRADEGSVGDPFLSLVPSLEQLSNSYSFASLRSLFDGFFNFATLITNATGTSNVLLNGMSVAEYDVYLEWEEIIDTNFKTLTLALPETATFYNLTVVPRSATIGGVLYGYQIQESYGLVIGQELDSISYRCPERPDASLSFFGGDCNGSIYDFDFEMHQDTTIMSMDSTLDYKATTWRSSIFNHETTSHEATTLGHTSKATSEAFESTSTAYIKTIYIPETTYMDKTTSVYIKTSDDPHGNVLSTNYDRWGKESNVDSITSSLVDYFSEKHNEHATSTVIDTRRTSEYFMSSTNPRKRMSTSLLEQMTTKPHDRMSTKFPSYRKSTGFLHQTTAALDKALSTVASAHTSESQSHLSSSEAGFDPTSSVTTSDASTNSYANAFATTTIDKSDTDMRTTGSNVDVDLKSSLSWSHGITSDESEKITTTEKHREPYSTAKSTTQKPSTIYSTTFRGRETSLNNRLTTQTSETTDIPKSTIDSEFNDSVFFRGFLITFLSGGSSPKAATTQNSVNF